MGETTLSLSSFSAILDYFKPIIREIIADPLVVVMGVIALLFTYWSVYLWIFGIKNARNLSFKEMLILFLFIAGIVTSIGGGVIVAIV